MLSALPVVLGFDFGGVLWWSQFAAALVIAVTALLLMGILPFGSPVGKGVGFVLLMATTWVLYSWLHCCSVSDSTARLLHSPLPEITKDWVAPVLSEPTNQQPTALSVAPDQTFHSAALALLVVPVLWVSGVLFREESRLSVFLGIVTVGISVHAIYGIACQVNPQWSMLGQDPINLATGFGMFVNRNNMAPALARRAGFGIGLARMAIAFYVEDAI